jgi:hypothetical protein
MIEHGYVSQNDVASTFGLAKTMRLVRRVTI